MTKTPVQVITQLRIGEQFEFNKEAALFMYEKVNQYWGQYVAVCEATNTAATVVEFVIFVLYGKGFEDGVSADQEDRHRE